MSAKKAVSKAAPPPATTAEWTILVYMAGDNNLDDFGQDDVMEMKTVGSSDKINVLVQRDTAAAGVPTVRYHAKKGTTLAQDVVVELGETNTGDPAVLADFIDWGLKNYPAKRTMVVLWNHGAGWDDTDIYEESRRRGLTPKEAKPATGGARRSGVSGRGSLPSGFVKRSAARKRHRGSFFISNDGFKMEKRRAIGFDDNAQDFLDSVEMKKVFDAAAKKAGKKFDVIGMDACLMSMVETGVQVAEAGDVFCGSEEIEPGAGWPYNKLLKALAAKPGMTGKELAVMIAKEFVASYPKSEVVTQSAIDLTAAGKVAAAADALGAELSKAMASPASKLAVIGAVSTARMNAQTYEHDDYVDLGDFAGLLATLLPKTAPAVKAVQAALKTAVLASFAPNEKVKRSTGLSIYLPMGKRSPLYANLAFAKGGWAKFLAAWRP